MQDMQSMLLDGCYLLFEKRGDAGHRLDYIYWTGNEVALATVN